jgi:hypothetical protein
MGQYGGGVDGNAAADGSIWRRAIVAPVVGVLGGELVGGVVAGGVVDRVGGGT